MGSTAASLFGVTQRRKATQSLLGVQTQYLKDNPNASTEGVLPEAILAAQPIQTPKPPPSAFDAANQGAQAMSDAARRYRRQRGAGQASTLSNGAGGDLGTAPTFRKQLLGR